MDRKKIDDEQIIERYLAGKLAPAEEQALEEAYLADPALLEEIKLAERLREGLRDLPEPQRAALPASRPRWLGIASSPRYGIAASLVAAAALLAAAALYLQGPDLGAAAAGGATPMRVVPLLSVRGDGNPNSIAGSTADEWTVLLLDAGFGDYDRYRAALVRVGGDEIFHVDGLSPTYEGMVALGVPSRVLAPGRYEIRLEAGKRDWPDSRTLDEVSRTPLTVTP